MSQLIDDLLKLSRVTRAEIRYESVDLSDMIKAIAENSGIKSLSGLWSLLSQKE